MLESTRLYGSRQCMLLTMLIASGVSIVLLVRKKLCPHTNIKKRTTPLTHSKYLDVRFVCCVCTHFVECAPRSASAHIDATTTTTRLVCLASLFGHTVGRRRVRGLAVWRVMLMLADGRVSITNTSTRARIPRAYQKKSDILRCCVPTNYSQTRQTTHTHTATPTDNDADEPCKEPTKKHTLTHSHSPRYTVRGDVLMPSHYMLTLAFVWRRREQHNTHETRVFHHDAQLCLNIGGKRT